MPTFAQLESTIPGIASLYEDWVSLRRDTDADPYDYQAFRQHVIFRGLPDPGNAPIEDFPTGSQDLPPEVPSVKPIALAPDDATLEEADANRGERPISMAEAAYRGPLSEPVAGTTVVTGSRPPATAPHPAPPPPAPPAPPAVKAGPAEAAPAAPITDAAPAPAAPATPATAAVPAPAIPAAASLPRPQPPDRPSSKVRLASLAALVALLGAAAMWWVKARRRRPAHERVRYAARDLAGRAATRATERAAEASQIADEIQRRARHAAQAAAAESTRVLSQVARSSAQQPHP